MTQLAPGSTAPAFTLPDFQGGDVVFDPTAPGHKAIVFYNVSCPTCQETMPWFDRLYARFGGIPAPICAVVQEAPDEARRFARDRSLTMPHLVDGVPYAVSRAYKLMNVPTLFLIDTTGHVVLASPAFVREHLEYAATLLASDRDEPPPVLFDDIEDIPLIKPG